MKIILLENKDPLNDATPQLGNTIKNMTLSHFSKQKVASYQLAQGLMGSQCSELIRSTELLVVSWLTTAAMCLWLMHPVGWRESPLSQALSIFEMVTHIHVRATVTIRVSVEKWNVKQSLTLGNQQPTGFLWYCLFWRMWKKILSKINNMSHKKKRNCLDLTCVIAACHRFVSIRAEKQGDS